MKSLRVIQGSVYVLSRGESKLFCKWLSGIDSFFVENGLRGLVRFSRFSQNVSFLQLSVTQREVNDPLCSCFSRAPPTSTIIEEQTGNIIYVSADIQFPAHIRGLWALAREIQTNDMSIRIRFDFLVSPQEILLFWIWPLPSGIFSCFGFWG